MANYSDSESIIGCFLLLLTRVARWRGLGRRSRPQDLFFWWWLPAKPATTTRKGDFLEGLQPSKPPSVSLPSVGIWAAAPPPEKRFLWIVLAAKPPARSTDMASGRVEPLLTYRSKPPSTRESLSAGTATDTTPHVHRHLRHQPDVPSFLLR